MGITKKDIFSDEINKLAALFKVLAHPARLSILQYISRHEGCICNDIVAEVGLAQPTISQHLKELKQADLIAGTISGTSICYCINKTQWQNLQQLLPTFLNNTYRNCC